ncbi:MAG: CoA transferase [Dehalococcoidales bacterium]|jgi:crotonobetainyl-CoA:carnitine CoA-transferase CaiB-like acyl-CoA transferase|nr:CoA transferase [Dehalococcoidales bacterium]
MLRGYRAVALTDEKGDFCARILAQMGAEVIHIYQPGEKLAYNYANEGEHYISLKLTAGRGIELFKRLISRTDFLIESLEPGYLTGSGLDYENLKQLNPALIMASITGFGQSGPYRNYRTSDLVASALGGQAYICGEPDQPPLKPHGKLGYYIAGLFAANGILIALQKRHSTGKGDYIDISIHECLAGTLDHVLVRYFYENEVASRQGSLYWNRAFRIFPCKDGYILLSLFRDWTTLVELMDASGMAGDLLDDRWKNAEERLKNLDHIIEIIEQWTSSNSVDELVNLGQLMRLSWARVATLEDVLNNPQLNFRGFFQEGSDSQSGKRFRYPGSPCKMEKSPWQIGLKNVQSPDYNQQIYSRELGLSDTEIADLTREGII